jgi:hypothetical protein
MTVAIWESYGFKLGPLANIRSKISEFKQQRRPQSQGSNRSNSSLLLEIILATPGITCKEPRMSIWLSAYKDSLYAHGTAHGMDME